MRTELNMLQDFLAHGLKNAQSVIDDFKIKFDNHPFIALDWSENVFRATAILSVYQEIIALIDKLVASRQLADFEITDAVKEKVLSETLHGAKIGSSSTSPVSNFAKLMKLSAWASVTDLLK